MKSKSNHKILIIIAIILFFIVVILSIYALNKKDKYDQQPDIKLSSQKNLNGVDPCTLLESDINAFIAPTLTADQKTVLLDLGNLFASSAIQQMQMNKEADKLEFIPPIRFLPSLTSFPMYLQCINLVAKTYELSKYSSGSSGSSVSPSDIPRINTGIKSLYNNFEVRKIASYANPDPRTGINVGNNWLGSILLIIQNTNTWVMSSNGTKILAEIGQDLKVSKTSFVTNSKDKVHTGFYNVFGNDKSSTEKEYLSVKQVLDSWLKSMPQQPVSDFKLILTGHSLGSSICILTLAYLQQYYPLYAAKTTVYTFGMPSAIITNEEAFLKIQKILNSGRVFSIINQNDFVNSRTVQNIGTGLAYYPIILPKNNTIILPGNFNMIESHYVKNITSEIQKKI